MRLVRILRSFVLLVALISLAALCFSCIGIESTIGFKKDGSGVLLIEYRVSRELTDLGGIEADVPFALSEGDFRLALDGREGLELLRFSEKAYEKDVVIRAEIAFESVESLSEAEAFRDMPMSLEKEDGEYVFRQKIAEAMSPAEAQALDERLSGSEERPAAVDDELLAPLLQGYELSFTVVAPGTVTYHNIGELDGRSVTYSIPLIELITQNEPLIFMVKWSI